MTFEEINHYWWNPDHILRRIETPDSDGKSLCKWEDVGPVIEQLQAEAERLEEAKQAIDDAMVKHTAYLNDIIDYQRRHRKWALKKIRFWQLVADGHKERAEKAEAELAECRSALAQQSVELKEARKRTHLLDDMVCQLKYAGVDKPHEGGFPLEEEA